MTDFKTTLVLEAVRKERVRQADLVMDGKFPFDLAEPERLNIVKLPVLGKVFGKASKEVNDLLIGPGDKAKLRTELIQLAAVATAWAEALTPD